MNKRAKTAKILNFRIVLLLLLWCVAHTLYSQPFSPDKHGYVKDPKFHKLIKEKGYELVANFHKVESGNDSLYASVYIDGEWKYINVYGELKLDKFDYQKRDEENNWYSKEYSGSNIFEEQVEMPRIESSTPSSNYSITKPSGKKWGTVHNETKEQGLPYIYDKIIHHNYTTAIIAKDNRYGLALYSGKIILEPTYERISTLTPSTDSKKLLLVKQNNKYGILDTTGEIITPIIYDGLYVCNYCGVNIFKISKGNKWGLLSSENQVILPTNYRNIEPIYNNVIRIQTFATNKYGLVDSEGKFIIDTTQDRIEKVKYYKDYVSHIKYRKDGLEGLLTNKGKPFVPQVYNHIESFQKGYAQVVKNAHRGLINKAGKEIIPPHYKVLYIDSKTGLIMAMDSLDKWGYINFKNKVKIKFVYDELQHIGKAEYFFKRDGEYGLMTSKEVVFKKFKYKKMRKIGAFYVVEENNLSGIIDENENILLPIKYRYIKDAHDFYQHGYCKVRIDGQYYGVDRYGNEALLRRY